MGKRVLIIESDREAAFRLAGELAAHAHETELAHAWDEALAKAARFKPSIAIVDRSLLLREAGERGPATLRELMDKEALVIAAIEYSTKNAVPPPAVEPDFDVHFFKPVPVARFLSSIDG